MTMLQTIFRNLGTDYDERVLPSITNEVLKAVVAQYNAEELLTKRDQVSEKIRLSLLKRAKDFNLIIEDVAITHLQFGVEFSRAIEQKQVAEQEAERAKYVVLKSEQERKAAWVGECTIHLTLPLWPRDSSCFRLAFLRREQICR